MEAPIEQVFKPYEVKVYSQFELHLDETTSRKRFLWFFFKVYPLALIAGFIAITVLFDLPLLYKFSLLALGLLFLIIWLTNRYNTEIIIGKNEIQTQEHTALGRKLRKIDIKAVEEIIVERYYLSNAGGVFYKLKMNNGSKDIKLISIPRLWMDRRNQEEISKILTAITGLQVKS